LVWVDSVVLEFGCNWGWWSRRKLVALWTGEGLEWKRLSRMGAGGIKFHAASGDGRTAVPDSFVRFVLGPLSLFVKYAAKDEEGDDDKGTACCPGGSCYWERLLWL